MGKSRTDEVLWKIDVKTAQFLPRRSSDPEPSPYGLLHMFILEAERDVEKGKEKIQHILSLHMPKQRRYCNLISLLFVQDRRASPQLS